MSIGGKRGKKGMLFTLSFPSRRFDKVVAKSGQNATRCRIDSSAMRARGGGGGGKKRKEERKEGNRVVGQSGPATSSTCPFELEGNGREGGGREGRNARRLMVDVETSVTSVDKTECPERYLATPAIRSNQTETHF